MLLGKDKYCACPHCGNKEFKDVSTVLLPVTKNEFNDLVVYPIKHQERFKCTRCGKEFSNKEIRDHKNKQG